MPYTYNDLGSVRGALEAADGDCAAIFVGGASYPYSADVELPTPAFAQGLRSELLCSPPLPPPLPLPLRLLRLLPLPVLLRLLALPLVTAHVKLLQPFPRTALGLRAHARRPLGRFLPPGR
eukprot:SAG11_NODE_4951_length_1711_cov_4.104839_1_plen_121_part_00